MSQVAIRVKDQIRHDYIYKAGKGFKLPTVKELASRYEVSRPTIGKAVQILATEGLITKKQGSGIYVEELPPANMLNNKEKRIGFVTSIFHDPLSFRVLEGVEKVTRQRGAILELARSNWDIEEEKSQITSMKKRGCEGVILWPRATRFKDTDEYLARDLLDFNIVVVDLYKPNMKRPHVIFDNITASFQLTKNLILAGRKKIAFLKAGIECVGRSVQDRIIGYKKALGEAGMSDLECVLSFDEINDVGLKNFFEGLSKLISPEVKADAIILTNDSYVPLAIKFLWSKGYKIPEDIILVGFDNTAENRTEEWPTTNPDFNFMGERAAELLFDKIEANSKELVEIVLPVPILQVSDSSRFNPVVNAMIDSVASKNPIGIKNIFQR